MTTTQFPDGRQLFAYKIMEVLPTIHPERGMAARH